MEPEIAELHPVGKYRLDVLVQYAGNRWSLMMDPELLDFHFRERLLPYKVYYLAIGTNLKVDEARQCVEVFAHLTA